MATSDQPLRMDETHKRLLDWTYGQPPSERLAALVLDDEGYRDIDPSHPLGGPDGGRDGECTRDGEKGVWAVYFPRGQQTLTTIEMKLQGDIDAARKHEPGFLVFVTNQELRHSERATLRALGGDIRIELLHLERVATNLDRQRMSSVREQFLRIPATPHSRVQEAPLVPLNVTASVIGIAHRFAYDAELLDRWVEIRATEIRKKSDEGHALARAAVDKKRKAEQEERAREAREAAEKARREQTDAVIPKRPWDVGIEIPRTSDILGSSGIFDSLAKQYTLADYDLRIPGMPGAGEPPKPPKPLSDEQIEEEVAAYRSALESRWPSCRDYLAGIAWSGMQFRIKNEAKSFLTDVEVILTFHGARGVDFEELDDFELMKVQDPTYEEPRHSLYSSAVPPMRLIRPKDHPIASRQNDDGDLEVIITLARLRPLSEWRSDEYGDEIVVVVDPGVDVTEVSVTYRATANGYGDVFEGESTTVLVEEVAMLDVLLDVIKATKDGA